jgi:hypothetical protein
MSNKDPEGSRTPASGGDYEDDDWHIPRLIEQLLEDLAFAQTQKEHLNTCADLIRLARHLSDDDINAVAAAVTAPPAKQARGRPREFRRAREIDLLLTLGPNFGGKAGRPRSEILDEIQRRNRGLSREAAEKALDSVQRDRRRRAKYTSE